MRATWHPRPRVGYASAKSETVYLAVALTLAGLVYLPITRNYFHGDDWLSLQRLVNEPPLRWIFRSWGGHLLAFRNALFSLFYVAFGPRPAFWFGMVLATHLVNVALLFAVIRRLTGSPPLACFGAAAWGVSPVMEGSLGFYSVYGHVVLGTILLVALHRVARRFEDPAPLSLREALAWYLLMLLGSVTFGVGIGVALVFPVVVSLLFSGRRASTAVRLLFASLPVVVVVGYRAAYVLTVTAYLGRQRAEAQLAWLFGFASYLRSDLGMLLHLLVVGTMSVVAGFAYPLRSYPSAAAYTIAVGILGLGLAVLVASPPPTRRLLIALALVVAGCYAVIAAGRATLYGSIPSLPAYGAATPRYHYVGPIGIAILLCLLLAQLGDWLSPGPRLAKALLVTWIAATLFLCIHGGWTINHFTNDRQTMEEAVRTVDAAINAAPSGETVYLPNQYAAFVALAGPSFVGRATIYTIYFSDPRDRRVHFVEPDQAIRDMALPGSRLAALLVSSLPR